MSPAHAVPVTRLPASVWVVLSLVLLANVGVLDYFTGREITFSLFYLLPVALSAWFTGRRHAVAMAVLSAVVCLVASLLWPGGHSHPAIPYLNGAARLAILLVVAWGVAELKALRQPVVKLVEKQTAALREESAARHRAEEQLERSEMYFRSLIEHTSDLFTILNADGTIRYQSPSIERLLGYDPAELVGQNAFRLVHPDDRPRVMRVFGQGILKPGHTETIEFRIRHRNGSWRVLEGIGKNLLGNRHLAGVVINSRDVTDRLQAAAEREELIAREHTARREAETTRDQLRELSRQLVDAQELERRRIARELHDQVGQILTMLKLALDRYVESRPPAATEPLAGAQATVSDLLQSVRNLSLDLRPAMLDDLGLLPTLRWHIERFSAQTQVRVELDAEGLERERFPTDIETAAYRITQEALTNVARYAGVHEVRVRLWKETTTLRLEIEDHGRGFDPARPLAARATSGLWGMSERVKLLGGQLTIDAHPGAGTRVSVELPLNSRPAAREAAA